MFSHARPVFVALAATLLIAACGSDDGATGAGSATIVADTIADTTPGTTPEATTDTTDPATEAATDDTTASTEAPARDVDADLAAAEAALLTLAELPEGWTDTLVEDVEVDVASDLDARIAECIGVASLTSSDASTVSGALASPDRGLIVNETVGVNATEQDARLVVASLTNPDVPECVAAAYTELGAAALSPGAVAEGAAVGDVTASRLAVGAAGDATQAIRVAISVIASDGVASELTVDHVVTRVGRSLASLSFEARVAPTAVETIDEVTLAAASRLPG